LAPPTALNMIANAARRATVVLKISIVPLRAGKAAITVPPLRLRRKKRE
jgi:hypothetical protein